MSTIKKLYRDKLNELGITFDLIDKKTMRGELEENVGECVLKTLNEIEDKLKTVLVLIETDRGGNK